jgi:hypothetical protein
MTEKIFLLTFCVVVTFLFSMNFNQKWSDMTFERVKNRNATWYWFEVFKIEKTKENYIKILKGLSIAVICVMTATLIMLLATL